jgi:CheY-like chemotaxis protein
MPGRRVRVVIAADDERALHAATAALSTEHDVIASATNAAAAMHATVALNPDVVVIDGAMPDLGGFETVAQLKASGASGRIIFLSTDASRDGVLGALSRGASGVVLKRRLPLDLDQAIDHAAAGRLFVPSPDVLPLLRTPGGGHHLQLYSTPEYLIDRVADFFCSAVDAGDAILAIASASHLGALDEAMRRRGVDLASLTASDRYQVLNSAEALDAISVGGMPDRVRFGEAIDPIVERALAAAGGPGARVSVFGEIAPILCARGALRAAARLEQIADAYASARPVSVLCAYSTECVGSHRSPNGLAICKEHAAIVPADPWT